MRPCLVGGPGRTTTHLLHQKPLVVRIPSARKPGLPGGVGLSCAVVAWEAVHPVAGKGGVGAAGPRGGQQVAAAAGEEEWKDTRKVKGR